MRDQILDLVQKTVILTVMLDRAGFAGFYFNAAFQQILLDAGGSQMAGEKQLLLLAIRTDMIGVIIILTAIITPLRYFIEY